MKSIRVFLYSMCAVLACTSVCLAWSTDPTVNTIVCNSSYDQREVVSDPDGSGGVVIGWEDKRHNGVTTRVYVQRLNSSGGALWTANGVAATTSTNRQYAPDIIALSDGGAIVVWYEQRYGNYDIMAQKFSSAGVRQWGSTAKIVCNAVNLQRDPKLCSDGADGVIIVWEDFRNGNYDIYMHRITSAGAFPWGGNGISVTGNTTLEGNPEIVADGSGGAFLLWHKSTASGDDIYGAHITGTGSFTWWASVTTAWGYQMEGKLCIDGSGGAIYVWQGERSQTNYTWDIYAQRMNSSGFRQWGSNGVPVCATYAFDNKHPVIIQDNFGGAIVACTEESSALDSDVLVQRINSLGSRLWGVNGVYLAFIAGIQDYPKITTDASGGAIVAWEDDRYSGSVYARRINSAGVAQWTANGVCVARGTPHEGPAICYDSSAGAILAWEGKRATSYYDVFAQRLDSTGALVGGMWGGATDLGSGWKWLSWFGIFNDSQDPWINHAQHDWMYCSGSSTASIWFWTSDMGWLWTSDSVYPYFWRSSDSRWIWYMVGSDNPRWFVRMNDGIWEAH